MNIKVRAVLDCPSCKERALSKEKILLYSPNDDDYYETNLADDMTGLTMQCEVCSFIFEVRGVDVLLNSTHVLKY